MEYCRSFKAIGYKTLLQINFLCLGQAFFNNTDEIKRPWANSIY